MRWLRADRLPLLVLAIGILTTLLFCNSERHYRQLEHERMERALASDVKAQIQARLNTTIAILDSVAGLFNSSQKVTRKDYATFFDSLNLNEQNLRGIQGIGYIARIARPQVAAFEQLVRADDQPDFSIRPPGRGDFSSAVVYLMPNDWRNQRAIGFDLQSEPLRRKTMGLAAETGEVTISPPVRLLQETEIRPQPGVLLFRPIFESPGQPFHSSRDRLRRLRGWTYAPLRIGDLLDSVIASLANPDKSGAAILVYDGTQPMKQRLLYDNLAVAGNAALSHPSWTNLTIANRGWLIGVQLDHRRLSPSGISHQLLGTALLGFSLSILAAVLTRSMVTNHLALQEAFRKEQAAATERALAATVFDTSPIGIIITDPDGIVIHVNSAFSQISGYSPLEARGHKANKLKSGRHDDDFYAQMWAELIKNGHWSGEIWNRHRNGQIQRHELNIAAVFNQRQQIVHYVGLLHDISERYSQAEQMRHLATHDPLTGLANRALLMEQLNQSLALARRQGTAVGLLFLDLNGFKPVNDQHGHSTGDALLQAVADRLQATVRESDTLCRQGGDEFVIMIPDAPDLNRLIDLAEMLQTALMRPYPGLPDGIRISASIGVARWPDHARGADGLLDAADNAMYDAKKRPDQRIAIATSVNT